MAQHQLQQQEAHASCSSTSSAPSSPCCQPPQHHCNHNKSSQKHVRFANQAEMRLIPVPWEQSDGDVYNYDDALANLWYSRRDFLQIKLNNRRLLRRSRRTYQGLTSLSALDAVYPTARLLGGYSSAAASSSSSSSSVVSSGSSVKEEQQVQALRQWGKLMSSSSPYIYNIDDNNDLDSRRGLEHLASATHHQARTDCKEDVWEAVLELQQAAAASQEEEDALLDVTMACASQTYSRAARLVAQWMGQADATHRVAPQELESLTKTILKDHRRRVWKQQQQQKKLMLLKDMTETTKLSSSPLQKDGLELELHCANDNDEEPVPDLEDLSDIDDDEDDSSCSSTEAESSSKNEKELELRQINQSAVGCTATLRSPCAPAPSKRPRRFVWHGLLGLAS